MKRTLLISTLISMCAGCVKYTQINESDFDAKLNSTPDTIVVIVSEQDTVKINLNALPNPIIITKNGKEIINRKK